MNPHNPTNEQAAQFAQQHAARLSDRERDFVRDILRHRWRGPSLKLSEKQETWLHSIAAKVRDDLDDDDIGALVERVERGAAW